MDTKTLIDKLNWRYATKEFDPTRTIPEDIVDALESSLALTPSSFGLQPWKFILVKDHALKDQMPAIAWNQQQPKDCSHMLVLLAKTDFTRSDVGRFIERMAEIRQMTVESLAGYEEFAGGFVDRAEAEGWISDWSAKQVYIALGQVMLSAAALGIDACPMEGIDSQGFDKLLGFEGSGYATVLGCALGYRAEGDKYAQLPKVRFETRQVVERR